MISWSDLSSAEVNKQLERGKEKLASLKTLCKDIAPEDKIKINKEHQKVVKEWRKRKRMCMDVVSVFQFPFLFLFSS